ncbi:HK97 family phage prohead protease [Sphingomonas aracearum]|uniref:HK97 family phage prohead protease n=1 Tax=Sphingomonas aracearum TaxID=2283317 RepID=A0A369VQZ6_9SPHN|nr:HK97 family phage prohead protease [Sphingomonas aracearum]RDE04804.1 HK97 family phage prohead protease [Sphingomonas aracearum]
MRPGSIRVAGYAAVFDRVDRGGDVVRRGALARARVVPLLWQHRGAPVGVIERIGEDAAGLRVVARVEHPAAVTLVRSGALRGLSIGFRVRAARTGRVRELTELELVEVSLVAQPMQPLATVLRVEEAAA